MGVEFIGANPCATLMRGSRRVGFVSLWDAEWSTHGTGMAVLAWADGDDAVRLLATDADLGTWLADTFSRHLPELEGLPHIDGIVDCEVREWRVDAGGARADVLGADGSRVAATISRGAVTRPGFVSPCRLGGATWTLTNLLTFCVDATLEVDGARVLGRPELSGANDDLTSTAFVATHETWTLLDPAPPSE
jgi:hypothetical protein